MLDRGFPEQQVEVLPYGACIRFHLTDPPGVGLAPFIRRTSLRILR
jgi:hypothetical protein